MLGAALNAHGEDSANLDQDNVDVSSPLSSSIALDAAGCPRTLLHMPQHSKIIYCLSPAKPCHSAS